MVYIYITDKDEQLPQSIKNFTATVDRLAIEQTVDVKAIDDLKKSIFNITEQIGEQEKAIDDLTRSTEGKLMRSIWPLAKYQIN